MLNFSRQIFLVGLIAAAQGPFAAHAGEESKARLFMIPMAGGAERGLLRSHLVPGLAELEITVRNLAPNHEHIVYGDGEEVVRFTTNGRGNANVLINLFATGNPANPTFDPRDEFVTVNDGVNDMLAAWVFASPANDPPRPQLNEVSALTRTAATQGTVDVRYDRLPNGNQRLAVALRDMAPGTYDVLVNDVLIASVTPNAAGVASVELRSVMGGAVGNVKPHKFRGLLGSNPRGDDVDVELAGVRQFTGKVEAQIPGL